MKRFTETMQLKDIIVLSATNEITLSGTVNRDHLHFDTKMNLTSTQLNVLLNQLQKLNFLILFVMAFFEYYFPK
jgi:hypothetical protein